MKPKIRDAAQSLTTQGFGWDFGEDCIIWYDTNTGEPPTREAIDAKLASMISDWEGQEYARKRQAEYPSIAELTVALYDTDDKAAIETKRAAVKAKYPKPS